MTSPGIPEIKILYRCKGFVICVKPAGVLSQRDASGEEGLDSILKKQLGVKNVYPVHRLDRPVGGVMIYALEPKYCSLSDGGFEKEYLAVVCGRPEADKGNFFDYIYKDGAKNKSFVADKSRKGVKDASLDYEVLETVGEGENRLSLVAVKLHTGRTHQIRVQFSSRGMPIVGDGKYGSRIKSGNIALFANRLTLCENGKTLVLEAFPEKCGIWGEFEKLSVK